MSTNAILERTARQLDEALLYGRPISPVSLRPCERLSVTMAQLLEYRREHPNPKILRKIAKLLAGCRQELPAEVSGDIIFNRFEPWDWRHDEVNTRGHCFELLETGRCRWDLPGGLSPACINEGWLFVENHQIAGAATFVYDELFEGTTLRRISSGRHWIWIWVFVDPPHRRKGIIMRRLSAFEARYGADFILESPNPHATALFKKTGFAGRHRAIKLMMPEQEMHLFNTLAGLKPIGSTAAEQPPEG